MVMLEISSFVIFCFYLDLSLFLCNAIYSNAMQCKSAEWVRYIAIYLGLPSECDI